MASTGTPNPNANPIWSSWPGVTNTASRLGIRRQALAQHVVDGELEEVIAADGSKRYNPETVDALATSLRAMQANESRGETNGDVVKAAVDLLKQEQDHVARLIELLINGFDRSLSAVNATNQQLREENLKLATVHWDAIAARESAMSEAAERETDRAKVDATNSRRQQILDALLPGVPKVVGAIGQALLAWGFSGSPEAQLLSSFQDEQLEALLESVFLSDDQKDLLREYLKVRKAARHGSEEGNQKGNEESPKEGSQDGNQENSQESAKEEKQREEGFAGTT